jgi:hypothetical protein
MIYSMSRRVLLLVVVALLLRAWIGEAMAGQMLAQQLHAPAAQAMTMHGPDCPGAMLDQDSSPADLAATLAGCQDCTLHALAAVPAVPVAPFAPAAPIDGVPIAFASAELRTASKPPIS